MKERHRKAFLTVICSIYAVGLAGFLLPWTRDLFAGLTWLSLLASFIVLLAAHERANRTFWASMLLIALAGYSVEVVGVHTGMLFGHYEYGPSLGVRILDVPLMIGLNWALLVYLSSALSASVFARPVPSVIAGAALMTGLDVLIEPFAMEFGLWAWEGGRVPLRNYVMWFLVSLVMHAFFRRVNPPVKNPLARPLAACLLLFFTLIDMLVIW